MIAGRFTISCRPIVTRSFLVTEDPPPRFRRRRSPTFRRSPPAQPCTSGSAEPKALVSATVSAFPSSGSSFSRVERAVARLETGGRRRTRPFHSQGCSIGRNIILNYKSHGDRRWSLRRRGEGAGVAHIDRADPETERPIPSSDAAFGSGFRPVSRRDHPARMTSEIISRLHVSRPATSTPWTRSRLDNRSCHDKKNTILHNRTIRDGRPVKSKRSRMRHRRKAHRGRPVRTLGVDRARGTNPRGGSEE